MTGRGAGGLVVVPYCDVKGHRQRAIPAVHLAFLQEGALGKAREADKTQARCAEEQEKRRRLDVWAKRKARVEEAQRLTYQKYAEYLALHARHEARTKGETVRYRMVGKRFRLHGRPELRRFRALPIRAPFRGGRAPRSRRLRTARRARSPARPEPPDDPDDDVARPGGFVCVPGGRR